MTYKKHKSLLSKHIIQEILPIFEDFFSSLDEKFDELTKEELTEIYLRDILNYVNNFGASCNYFYDSSSKILIYNS